MVKRKQRGGGEITNFNKKSAYIAMDNKLFLNFIFAIAFMGFFWFLISTFLLKHKYSEVLCYSLMLVSVIFSLFLMISIGVVRMEGSTAFKKILNIVKFVVTKSLPGIIVAIQLAIMIKIMSKNADYLHSTSNKDRPQSLDLFNSATSLGLLVQLFMYRKHLLEVIFPTENKTSISFLGGFILIGILTSFCISQVYIILNFLKVDG